MQFGILWDLDGTIVDSVKSFSLAMNRTLEKLGSDKRISCEDYNTRFFGTTFPEILDQFLGWDLSQSEKQAISADFFSDSRRLALEGNLTLINGVETVLNEMKSHLVPMAIASSSNLEMILGELEAFHLLTYFDNIISGDLLPSKPAPDVFQVAAASLSLKPAQCIVFEDSIAGVQAAKTAGMKCVAITTSKSADQLRKADLIINGYAEVDFEKILRVLEA